MSDWLKNHGDWYWRNGFFQGIMLGLFIGWLFGIWWVNQIV